jgi:hypothetical protein
VEKQGGGLDALQGAEAGPARDLADLHPVEEDVQVEPVEVVAHQHVRVVLRQPI